jgi:UPF0716 protein FxsA
MIVLIILIAIPLIEIAVMIKVGQWIGFWPVLWLVIATFILGATIVGRSGLRSALKVRDALARGEPPVAAMIDSALVWVAGVLLMTPGFLADLVGLTLLIPPLRAWLAKTALRNATVMGTVRVDEADYNAERPHGGARDDLREGGSGPVIEGEFERLDERPIDPKARRPAGPSGRT